MSKNYYELLKNRAEKFPCKKFLQIGAAAYSYRDFLTFVDNLAADFTQKKQNISANAAILITAKDFLQQAGAFFALQKLEFIPILMHNGFSAEETLAIVNKNNLQGWWKLEENGRIFYLENLPAAHNEQDIMGVLTSGSTGVPKILYRTYFSWCGFFAEQNRVFNINENTVLFLHGSLSFTGNLNMLAGVLFAGGTIVTSLQLNGKRWHKLIRGYQANSLYMVPSKLQILAEAEKGSYEGLKNIITGSQLVTEKCSNALYKAFPQVKIILYYGASELNYITYRVLARNEKLQLENLGRPFNGIHLSIEDNVIFVDTPYHISGIEIPFSCQDTGYIDEKGNLIFQGRKTQWINRGGYKVSCLKLENKIKDLDNIADVVVLPCKDELRGQEIAAFVVIQGLSDLKTEEIQAKKKLCRQQIHKKLDAREMPRIIKFIEKIPLNDRGKTDKEALLCGGLQA